MRIWAVILLLLLPLQWVSAAVDRYSPHPASEAAQAQLLVEAESETDHSDEHDCPQCHVLCIKALFHEDLPRLRPHSRFYLSRHTQAPPSAILATPERPPQHPAPDTTGPA